MDYFKKDNNQYNIKIAIRYYCESIGENEKARWRRKDGFTPNKVLFVK